jgi:probable rRNA maturation factor
MTADLSANIVVAFDVPCEDHVNEDSLRQYVERVLRREGVTGPVEVSLLFTSDEVIRTLNAQYRENDSVTDVLSFPQYDGLDEIIAHSGAPRLIGDVVLSYPQAERQAHEFGHSLAREIGYLVVHGVLHLLGFDHETEPDRIAMRMREEAALVDIPRGDLAHG